MKPLHKMNSVEKAQLLHSLFPDEIPAFLDFVLGVGETIREHEAMEREKMGKGIITFDFWLHLLKEAEDNIRHYGVRLHRKAGLFASQLFNGHQALYTIYCLQLLVEDKQHPNPKFTEAVRLLFDTDKIH